ncbi:Permease protein of ABC transporter system for polysaccharides [Bifidobacterium longum subsp. longum]|jgi:ABC-2 type transport system permease protein|nr:ABC transporter permease [Bifidobacterium longum]TCF64662.1 Permease protein of ABC transporter system for polysaccharides [Bifidobacterium longum subsp. longum]
MGIVKRLSERYRYSWVVLKEMVKTDFQLRYQGSFLGIAWSILKPLMLFCVMYMVFVRFLKFSDGTPTFPLVLLLGISLWNFFSEATSMGLNSITGRGDVLRKVDFPKIIIVISATIGSLIGLAINMCVVLLFCLLSGQVHFTWRVLLLPINFIEFYILALGCALLLATMNVYFRDIQHIWDVLQQTLFYATPIIYPLSMVEQRLGEQYGPLIEKIMLLNPVAQIIQDIRHNLIAPDTTPTIWNLCHQWWIQLIPIAIVLLCVVLGLHVFKKHDWQFAEVL